MKVFRQRLGHISSALRNEPPGVLIEVDQRLVAYDSLVCLIGLGVPKEKEQGLLRRLVMFRFETIYRRLLPVALIRGEQQINHHIILSQR